MCASCLDPPGQQKIIGDYKIMQIGISKTLYHAISVAEDIKIAKCS